MRMEHRHTQTQIYFSAGDCYDYSFGTPVAGCSFRRWTLEAAAAAATRLQGWQGGKQGGRFNPPRIQHRGFSTADSAPRIRDILEMRTDVPRDAGGAGGQSNDAFRTQLGQ